MSKRESLIRYNLIIRTLRLKPSSFNQIFDKLKDESEFQGYNFMISKRTFQRDLEDIKSLYDIEIQYNYYDKVYYIDSEGELEVNNRILEAFDTFNALNISDRISNYIHFEKRRPQGTENLFGLLHAIKNEVQIKFKYQKFWESEKTHRTVEPLALKEFKHRWYIIANDNKDKKIKTFALDRLTELEITRYKFKAIPNFDVNEYFKFSFGIIGSDDSNPQKILLSFDPIQGKYIKTLPLHHSQQIITDNEEELVVKLELFITHDFFMEILSFGDNVKVLEPKSLIKDIKNSLQSTLKHY